MSQHETFLPGLLCLFRKKYAVTGWLVYSCIDWAGQMTVAYIRGYCVCKYSAHMFLIGITVVIHPPPLPPPRWADQKVDL